MLLKKETYGLTNLVPIAPATAGGGTSFGANKRAANCNDGDMTTFCYAAGDGYIQFDMGAVKQVQTIYIAQGHNRGDGDIGSWEVYVFSSVPSPDDVTSYSGSSNHCFTGYLEGFKSCTQSISGQYIVIPTNESLRISELLAYDAPLVDVTLDRYENMTYDATSGEQARMFG